MALNFIIDGPKHARVTIVTAHGAGAPMDSPWMDAVAQALTAAGLRVIRFEFAYMAARRAVVLTVTLYTRAPTVPSGPYAVQRGRPTLARAGFGGIAIAASAAAHRIVSRASRLYRSDVDFLHLHHSVKRAFSFIAATSQRLGKHARRDLPGYAPFIFAPTVRTLLAAIADDGVPVTVGLLLIVSGDLKRERFVTLNGYHGVARKS